MSAGQAAERGMALALLVLVAPMMAIIALGLFGVQGRPILIAQTRSGLGGRPFTLVKFRTMSEARGADGRLLPDAARTGRLGRLLRRSRLDELPELWNVARGEMAIIGPRPLFPETIAAMADGARRGAVRPGLTGWAQVNGGPLLTQHDKLALDLWYVSRASLALDLLILWRTFGVILAGDQVKPTEVGRAHAGAGRRGG